MRCNIQPLTVNIAMHVIEWGGLMQVCNVYVQTCLLEWKNEGCGSWVYRKVCFHRSQVCFVAGVD